MPRLSVIVPAILALLLFTSCGGKSSSSSGPTGGLDALLSLVPDTPETRASLFLFDWALLERQQGVKPLTYPTDSDKKGQYLADLFPLKDSVLIGGTPFVSGLGQQYGRSGDLERYLGFRRVDQTALAGTPPMVYQATTARRPTESRPAAYRTTVGATIYSRCSTSA
jgi:hypothetical protein